MSESRDRTCPPRYVKCVVPTHVAPFRSASVCTVLRLFFQYLRHTTNPATDFPLSSSAAESDFRYERIGMHVVSHQVGDPMTTRS